MEADVQLRDDITHVARDVANTVHRIQAWHLARGWTS